MEIFTSDNFNSTLVRFVSNYTRATEKGIVKFITLNEETASALGIEEVSLTSNDIRHLCLSLKTKKRL